MSENKKARSVTEDTEQPDPITRSVMALARRTRRGLSPWVQRYLGAAHETADSRWERGHLASSPLPSLTRRPERAERYRRHRQTAFTTVHTRSLVGRAQRVVERGTVWRPDVGSIKPTMVARFADAIVERFPSIGAKYRLYPSDAEAVQGTELPLPEGLMVADLRPAPPLERSVGSAPSPATLPPLPHQAAPSVQQAVTPPPVAKRPTPPLPKGARLFSQVEELPTIGGEVPTADEPSEEQLTRPGSAQGQQDTTTSESAEMEDVLGQPEMPSEPGRLQPTKPPRIDKPVPPVAAEQPLKPTLAQATSFRRLPLMEPPAITHREATAYLVSRGWRFKRKESSAPAAPGLVARAVDGLELPSQGRPLVHKPRVMMERVIGQDFSDVRIHTANLSPLNVQAATRGRDVYVEPGQDRFDTPESLSLLGHELTHVAQGGGIVSAKPVAQMAILPQARTPARLEGEEAQAESTEQTILALSRPTMVQRAEETGSGAEMPMPSPPVGQPLSSGQVPSPSFPSPRDFEMGKEELVGTGDEDYLPETKEEEEKEGYLPAPEQEEEEGGLLEVEEPEEEKPDLDRLAQQVYPFIKRLLAVERERMAR
jgi:hypothetical protein